ncbi:uncharacterized protein LOC105690046 [Athalia rosae]|uniref:uncharacterized protein LOC105690046 n=1 Tax=Athalia rosae TaxID=37344 RepID=UPI0020345306|nr:uncharacterized protein LOC105690046 [Athalia rosae]XP_048510137.1 uncharacterized protein LOC105690046 [Athalia rosae]
MTISKSGYAPANGSKLQSIEKGDNDSEFWDMMTMLDLGVPCPLTRLETSYSPRNSFTSIASFGGRNSLASHVGKIEAENEVDKIIESIDCARATNTKNFKSYGCCPEDPLFKETTDGPLDFEPCSKSPKVVCLGDGTIFDDNFVELLEDSSIKICPIETGCTSGGCSAASKNFSKTSHSCNTCSSDTRPVKYYVLDDETKPSDNAGQCHNVKNDTKSSAGDDKTDSDGYQTAEESPVQNYFNPIEGQDSVGRKFSSDRTDAILNEAKKELREAGKLYNKGKYVTQSVIGEDFKNRESSEFDNFGAEVASSLKTMGKQRAKKLKEIISQTLRSEKSNKF